MQCINISPVALTYTETAAAAAARLVRSNNPPSADSRQGLRAAARRRHCVARSPLARLMRPRSSSLPHRRGVYRYVYTSRREGARERRTLGSPSILIHQLRRAGERERERERTASANLVYVYTLLPSSRLGRAFFSLYSCCTVSFLSIRL